MGNRNPRVSYTIRVVAGLYLIYLGISAARAPFTAEGTSVATPLAVTIGTILALIGALFAVTGLMGYRYIKNHPEEFEDPEETEETEKSDSVEDGKESARSSILQKAALPEHLQAEGADDEEEKSDTDEE
ncbi:MAG: DUF2892 domain-containing protein [Lachnospiraceae bacterium]|nr:DUF2892 domain-containing protein [Lachnospiraceae bacterium]